MAPAYASANGINNGDMVTLTANGKSVDVPALLQPGMAKNSLALALGYGRKNSGKVATDLGVNAYQFMPFVDDTFSAIISGASGYKHRK